MTLSYNTKQMKKYQPQQFEKKWIAAWDKNETYKTSEDPKKEKMYVLDMFPYPSGAGLHVGHPRGYTATDILARHYRMSGYSVLHPMGWDAFGLPAENAAIKAKKNPIDMVPVNIANFKKQMKMLGFSYDWSREFTTTDPEYYKWTQWLFIQFFKMGLLYKKNTPINFCPFCKTGLAEEEVLPNGRHERCGNLIEKRELPQWIFRITKYGDQLLEDLKLLEWPPGILEMQKNWIGRKEGMNITYKIKETDQSVVCFTTRPDTNFGATFIVVAPEHDLVKKILSSKVKVPQDSEERLKEIDEYVAQSQSKTEIERIAEGKKKTGVFTGLYAINNLNGEQLPIWISDFVLGNFGTGAVVGVPAHDLRDYDFALEFGIKVIRVVVGSDGDTSPIKKREQVQEEEGKMINSEFLNGIDIHEATKKIMDYLVEKGWGERIVTYHLRDWIFSRQRYWGEPIPMVYCQNCASNKISYLNSEKNMDLRFRNNEVENKIKTWRGEVDESLYGWFPLEEDQLPLKLPYVKSYEPPDTGESPLSLIKDFVKTTCPHCGGEASRETDTMPNWAGSSWYFFRFADPHNDREAWSMKTLEKFFPVDWYVGGAEHAVLHLLYARFWVKALQDIGLSTGTEPFMRLRNVGMLLAEDNRKMSKSWGNVINPDEVVAEYGADALRVYEMFMAPFSQEIAWSTASLQGVYRFLGRVWMMYQRIDQVVTEDKKLVNKLNKTILKVSEDIKSIKFNTAIASMMEFLNAWEDIINKTKEMPLSKENAQKFLKILSPFAPFIAEEIWSDVFKEKDSIHLSSWPEVGSIDIETEIELPVQVNGKVRAIITTAVDASQDEVIATAAKEEKVASYISQKDYKVVFVKNKILNFIVR